MRKIIFITLILAFAIYGKAQSYSIVSLEDQRKYLDGKLELPENKYIYFKDINHTLDKYVGVWKGTYAKNGYTYEFRVKKATTISSSLNMKNDILIIRYRITDSKGKLIFSTLSFNDESYHMITGLSLLSDNSWYKLSYVGEEADCGQSGYVIIKREKEKMKLVLRPDIDMYSCEAKQILPTETILLTKIKL